MPVNIDGIEATTVCERLSKMKEDTKGEYSIDTEIDFEAKTENVFIVKAIFIVKANLTIKDRGTYTGMSYCSDGQNAFTRFSALEIAETCAIGRALAAAGYFGNTYASADEIWFSINAKKTETAKTFQPQENEFALKIKKAIENLKISKDDENKLLEKANITAWEQITKDFGIKMLNYLNDLKKKIESNRLEELKKQQQQNNFDQDILM